jgi:hypothetical protein
MRASNKCEKCGTDGPSYQLSSHSTLCLDCYLGRTEEVEEERVLIDDEDFALAQSIDFELLDELDNLPPIQSKPVVISHCCPKITTGGKKWSTVLARGENCPVCGKMEIDEEGNISI